jgi:hypothetical protein
MDLAKLTCWNSPEWSSRDWQETLSVEEYNGLNENYTMNVFHYTILKVLLAICFLNKDYRTSSARRYYLLDPRLNWMQSSFIITF